MDIDLLNDLEISLTAEVELGAVETSSARYSVRKHKSLANEIFRPVVMNSTTSSAGIGDPFTGVINIVQILSTPSIDAAEQRTASCDACLIFDLCDVSRLVVEGLLPRGATELCESAQHAAR